MDCIVHGVAKSGTGLSNFHFHFRYISKYTSFVAILLLFSHLQSTSCVWLFATLRDCREPGFYIPCFCANPKGNQSWVFTGRTDAESEAPILWPSDAESWLIEKKNLDSEKEWGQEEKEVTEDEMVGWYQWLNWHEFEQTPGGGGGQGSLAAVHGVAKSRTQLNDWMTTIFVCFSNFLLHDMSINLSIPVPLFFLNFNYLGFITSMMPIARHNSPGAIQLFFHWYMSSIVPCYTILDLHIFIVYPFFTNINIAYSAKSF